MYSQSRLACTRVQCSGGEKAPHITHMHTSERERNRCRARAKERRARAQRWRDKITMERERAREDERLRIRPRERFSLGHLRGGESPRARLLASLAPGVSLQQQQQHHTYTDNSRALAPASAQKSALRYLREAVYVRAR